MVYSQNPVNHTVMFNKFVGKVMYYGLFPSPLIHYPCTVWMGVNCGLFSKSSKLIILLC